MKFTVDIDLDWINEDQSIDEQVKTQIINNIESKVLSQIKKQVLDQTEERIEAQVTMIIRETVTDKVKDLMSMDRTATDSYGRVVKEHFTIESLLIDAIDAAISKKTLNSDGRQSDEYNAKYTQFQYFATKDIPKMVDEKVKLLAEGVKKDIENLVSEKIKTQVADKLTSLIVDNSTALSLRK